MSWGNWRNNSISKKKDKDDLKKGFELFFNSITVFIIIVVALLVVLLPYSILMERFVKILSLFFFVSLIYFGIFADKEDRNTMINMWKIYIPSVFVLVTTIYSIEIKNFNTKSVYLKTKLNYNLSMKNNNIDASFIEYSNYVEKNLKTFEGKKLNHPSELTDKYIVATPQEKEYYFLWYINFLFGLLNIITIFMFLWYFRDLKIKENILNTFKAFK